MSGQEQLETFALCCRTSYGENPAKVPSACYVVDFGDEHNHFCLERRSVPMTSRIKDGLGSLISLVT